MALAVTKENLKQILESKQPVVIDFWAEWCGPCRMIGPVVEELAKEYEGRVVVAKCNVEECEEAVAKFGIRNIPTLIFIKDGMIVDKHVGATSKEVLAEKIEKML